MAINKGNEIPTIDVALVTVTKPGTQDEIALELHPYFLFKASNKSSSSFSDVTSRALGFLTARR